MAISLHDVTKWRAMRPPWAYATVAANSAARSMPEDYDFRPALAALEVPVLVVQGDDDYLPAATWTDGVPGVERVEVSEAGHLPYIDSPDQVGGLVRDFVLAVASEK